MITNQPHFNDTCIFIVGADVGRQESAAGTTFRYPSYVQDIMGDIFSLGFGPFRSSIIISFLNLNILPRRGSFPLDQSLWILEIKTKKNISSAPNS